MYEQLYDRIVEMVADGRLGADEKLPTVRQVAKDLGVNPNTVQKAYGFLETQGVIYSIPSKGSYVCDMNETGGGVILANKAVKEFTAACDKALRFGAEVSRLHGVVDEQASKRAATVKEGLA